MKKIVNGKTYNTETAEYIGCRERELPGDLYHIREELYQRKDGEFFLYGVGGAYTRYAVSCGGNSMSGGDAVIPLSRDRAMEWAEEYLSADTVEKIFVDDPAEKEENPIKRISMLSKRKPSEIAEELGIPSRTISSWIAGDRVAPQYVLNLIAEHYGVKI